MATTVQLFTAPTYRRQGNDQQQHMAKYHVTVDDVVPGARAIELGRTATSNPVPLRGAPMSWGGYFDPSAYALDFQADPLPQGDGRTDFNKDWLVTVTWRPPRPGQDEQPGSFDVNPLEREKEYLVEWRQEEKLFSRAVAVDGFRVDPKPAEGAEDYQRNAGVRGFVINPAFEYAGPISRQINIPTLVVAYNVASETAAFDLNDDFENTLNDDTWNVRGLSVSKHHARYERADTSSQLSDLGTNYYRLQARVQISKFAFYEEIPNIATRYWDADTAAWFEGDAGRLLGQVIVKNNGQKWEEDELDLDEEVDGIKQRQLQPFTRYYPEYEADYNDLPF